MSWSRWFGRRGIEPGLLFGDGLFEVLEPPLKLLIVELFRAAAKPVALKTMDQKLKPFDLGQRRAQDQL
jgi:hypothetical protein